MVKKIVDNIDNKKIADEWNRIIEKRAVEIKNGNDKSLLHILYPEIEKRVKELDVKENGVIIDCGCGSGYVANKICFYCKKIIGIDISAKSIEIARKEYKDNKNAEFQESSIEDFGEKNAEYAEICIANMVLSNIFDCRNACAAIWKMLKKQGRLLITIPHPCFWSEYWGYADQDWFEYKEQICISGDFNITGVGSLGVSTHIHRPLEMYIEILKKEGYAIIEMKELYSKSVPGKNNFKKPRCMFIEAEKIEK